MVAPSAPTSPARSRAKRTGRFWIDDLVVGPLQKRGIDGAERLVAFRRHAGREGYRVLLGDAHVEGAGREFLGEHVDAGAGRHGGRDGDDLPSWRACSIRLSPKTLV